MYILLYILYIYGEKRDKYFSSFLKIQITQQHSKYTLKNTYRIKEIIVKNKIHHFKRRS